MRSLLFRLPSRSCLFARALNPRSISFLHLRQLHNASESRGELHKRSATAPPLRLTTFSNVLSRNSDPSAPFCSIVPPHILKHIAHSPIAPKVARKAAQHTLSLTHPFRDVRSEQGVSRPSRGGPGPFLPASFFEGILNSPAASEADREMARHNLELIRPLRKGEVPPEVLIGKPAPPQPPELGSSTSEPDASSRPNSEEATFTPISEPDRPIYTCNSTTRLPGTLIHPGDTPSDIAASECSTLHGHALAFFRDIFHHPAPSSRMICSVHFSRHCNDAFWDGQQMVFGDGDGCYFNRFTSSIDVIAHELTHQVVSSTCNLCYYYQPGALNESLADVFASMVKQHHLKQTADEADWLIGQNLFTEIASGPGTTPVALRSLKAPGTAYNNPALGKDPQPAHMADFVVTALDSGGIHINSGIPNRAFYLVATALGGCSWERAGKIWYAVMTDVRRLPQNATFEQFANRTLQKAAAMYGDDVRDIVEHAWREVGVIL
jgi:hypothetical protein